MRVHPLMQRLLGWTPGWRTANPIAYGQEGADVRCSEGLEANKKPAGDYIDQVFNQHKPESAG